MKKAKIKELEKRGFKEIRIDIGDKVICDNCGMDYSDRTETGGFLIGSRGWCPSCEPETRKLLKQYNELGCITAECPPNMSHKDWILAWRKGRHLGIIRN